MSDLKLESQPSAIPAAEAVSEPKPETSVGQLEVQQFEEDCLEDLEQTLNHYRGLIDKVDGQANPEGVVSGRRQIAEGLIDSSRSSLNAITSRLGHHSQDPSNHSDNPSADYQLSERADKFMFEQRMIFTSRIEDIMADKGKDNLGSDLKQTLENDYQDTASQLKDVSSADPVEALELLVKPAERLVSDISRQLNGFICNKMGIDSAAKILKQAQKSLETALKFVAGNFNGAIVDQIQAEYRLGKANLENMMLAYSHRQEGLLKETKDIEAEGHGRLRVNQLQTANKIYAKQDQASSQPAETHQPTEDINQPQRLELYQTYLEDIKQTLAPEDQQVIESWHQQSTRVEEARQKLYQQRQRADEAAKTAVTSGIKPQEARQLFEQAHQAEEDYLEVWDKFNQIDQAKDTVLSQPIGQQQQHVHAQAFSNYLKAVMALESAN